VKKLEQLKRHLKDGQVYRRSDLMKWSNSVGRHLPELVKDGTLNKLSGGLYYKPKESTFGKVPVDENELVRTFLKDDDFLVTNSNYYNSLGLGTTQLYNTRRVYNHKRHGTFTLGNRSFEFVRRPYVPKKLTKEFLLVDLVNNLKTLEEDQNAVLTNVPLKAREMDSKRLKKLVHKFGTVNTKKFFEPLTQ
jgi:hypothetical protein